MRSFSLCAEPAAAEESLHVLAALDPFGARRLADCDGRGWEGLGLAAYGRSTAFGGLWRASTGFDWAGIGAVGALLRASCGLLRAAAGGYGAALGRLVLDALG